MQTSLSSRSLTSNPFCKIIEKNCIASPQSSHFINFQEPTDYKKPAHQDGSIYYCNGFSLPLELIKSAYKEYNILLKKNKQGLRSVFQQIAYLCLTQESGMCFKKQSSLGYGCSQLGHKALGRKQVTRHEATLVALGLYKRSRHPNRKLSYDRLLTPLGIAVYLLLSKKIYFIEKMSQRNQKNVPSQLLRHKRNILINTTVPDSQICLENSSPPNKILCELEKESGIKITNIDKKYRFDYSFAGEETKAEKRSMSELAKMRQMLDEKLEKPEPITSKDKGYLQHIFRKQAQKQIDITRHRLYGDDSNSFNAMQRRAYENALIKMRDMGIFDENNRVIKGTDEDAKKIFEIYHQAFLTREKRNKEPQSMASLVAAVHSKKQE